VSKSTGAAVCALFASFMENVWVGAYTLGLEVGGEGAVACGARVQ
jgi:hypothetical protein